MCLISTSLSAPSLCLEADAGKGPNGLLPGPAAAVGSAAAGTASHSASGASIVPRTLLLLCVTGGCSGARLSTYRSASQPLGCTTTYTCTGSFMAPVVSCRRSNSWQLSVMTRCLAAAWQAVLADKVLAAWRATLDLHTKQQVGYMRSLKHSKNMCSIRITPAPRSACWQCL